MTHECPYCHSYVNQIEEHILVTHKDEIKFNIPNTSSSDFEREQSYLVNSVYDQASTTVSYSDEHHHIKTNKAEASPYVNNYYQIPDRNDENLLSTHAVESAQNYSKKNFRSDSVPAAELPCPSYMSDDNSNLNLSYQSSESSNIANFEGAVLQLLSNDEIGRFCKTDQALSLLGECLFHRLILLGRINSSAETVSHMRILAALFVEFQKCAIGRLPSDEIHFMAMFDRENFPILRKTLGNVHLNKDYPDVSHKYCSILRTTVDILKENQLFGYKERLSEEWNDYLRELEGSSGCLDYSVSATSQNTSYYPHEDASEIDYSRTESPETPPLISIKDINSLKDAREYANHSRSTAASTSLFQYQPQPLLPSNSSLSVGAPPHSPNSLPVSLLQHTSQHEHNTVVRRKAPLPFENQSKSGRRRYLRWKAEDTALILELFAKYIQHEDEGCKGSLPGMGELRTFCSRYTLESLSGLELVEACKALKVKVFNERKKLREKIALERSRMVENSGQCSSGILNSSVRYNSNGNASISATRSLHSEHENPDISDIIHQNKAAISEIVQNHHLPNLMSKDIPNVTIHQKAFPHEAQNLSLYNHIKANTATTSYHSDRTDVIPQQTLPSLIHHKLPSDTDVELHHRQLVNHLNYHKTSGEELPSDYHQ